MFYSEVSSIEWEFINMSEQEEDLIYRMYKLVGDRWNGWFSFPHNNQVKMKVQIFLFLFFFSFLGSQISDN